MKKIREKSKEFAEHERIAEENNSDSNVRVEQNSATKSNRQKVKGEKRTSYSNPADCYECSTYNLGRQKYDRHCTCHHISTKALKSIILS